MDELVTRQNALPTMAIGELKTFVDNITYNINAIEAERRRVGKYGADQATLDSLEWQEIQLRAIKLKALAEFGKRSAEMETSSGSRVDLVRSADEVKTKSDQLAELGVTRQRANEYEKMYEHEEIVNQYVDDCIAEKKMPSQRGVLKAIRETESYIEEEEGDKQEMSKHHSEHGEKIHNGVMISRRINEIEKLMANAKNEYTVDDAEEEFNVIMNEFMSKLRRVIEVRNDVIKGNRRIKQLIIDFSKQLKELRGEI